MVAAHSAAVISCRASNASLAGSRTLSDRRRCTPVQPASPGGSAACTSGPGRTRRAVSVHASTRCGSSHAGTPSVAASSGALNATPSRAVTSSSTASGGGSATATTPSADRSTSAASYVRV